MGCLFGLLCVKNYYALPSDEQHRALKLGLRVPKHLYQCLKCGRLVKLDDCRSKITDAELLKDISRFGYVLWDEKHPKLNVHKILVKNPDYARDLTNTIQTLRDSGIDVDDIKSALLVIKSTGEITTS